MMGDELAEIIDLQEYREKKEAAEHQEIVDDIRRLQIELRSMTEEMDSDAGPYLYQQEWLDQLPILMYIDTMLDGYYDIQNDDTSEKT